MSCMSHVCRHCGHQWFDNLTRPPCPMCGSTYAAHYFDEDLSPVDPDAWDEAPDFWNDNEDAY